MSKADFTAQQAAIAPAVAELDRPKIEVGQVWRCRDGEKRMVLSNDGNPFYPWNLSNGLSVDAIGCECAGVENADGDLMELVQDASGFTIWSGGECPVREYSVVTMRFRDGAEATGARAGAWSWTHRDGAGDIVAYKVDEAAKSPLEEAPMTSPMTADAKAATGHSFERLGQEAVGVDLGDSGEDRHVVSVEIPPGYYKLFDVLMQAFKQAADGKGKERHARTGVAFEDQPMSQINKQLGSVDGFIYQAHKKSLESKRLPDGRGQAELLGAIVYLAGAVIARDTWAAESLPKD